MSKVAFVFPGQGSQRVGMGRTWCEASASAQARFDQASEILEFDLAELCFAGPDETLTRTENAQPALFVTGFAAWELLSQHGHQPLALAGHSLGEYTALAAAGVFSFEDGLRAVRARGLLMSDVGERVQGGMAAILGLSADQVAEACREAASGGVVECANFNSPEQTVISGELGAVEAAMALARARGARRAIRLNVSAPFHCSLMAPLAEKMRPVLESIPMLPPALPVVLNVTAHEESDPTAIRAALLQQLAGAVRWTESVQRLAYLGALGTVEVGPGKVLTGLTPRICSGLAAWDTDTALGLDRLEITR